MKLTKLRSHIHRPSPAMVVALLALFIALGGTAMAAFVVSSNSQIAPGTIYGHNAPAGKNKNVVADSVSGADVKESTLGQVPSAANGARRIAFNHPDADASPANVLTLDEMTLKAQCHRTQDVITTLDLYVASTVSSDINFIFGERNNQGQTDMVANGYGIAANGQQFLQDVQLLGGSVERAEGQLVYHNANRVIALTLHAVANSSSHRCQVTGVAVPAPG